MRAHDEHGNRGFRKAPRTDRDIGGTGRHLALSAETATARNRLGERVFHVQPAALEQLRRRIEALGRRAARLGVEPVGLVDTEERDADGRVLVVLRGHAPVLAGWTLAAIVEHRGDRATVRPVSEHGERLTPDAFATATCEHCLLRRRRRRTYVVVHADSGEVRQVGSGCLRDFVGGLDPERACRRAEHLALARAELKRHSAPALAGSSTDRCEPTLEEFAAHAARVLRVHGFTSREQTQHARKPASAEEALRSLEETPEAPDRLDRALADGALRWARTLLATKPELSRFERNALTALSNDRMLTRRDRGLVCALIAVYRQRRARSRHLADPGRRVEVTVLVERVIAQPSERHGTVRRCELIDTEVNRLVWWQTQGAALRSGEVVTLIGRVQRHTRFSGTPVTVLSHCRPKIFRAPMEAFAARPGT